MTQAAPFNINEALPGDTDVISQHPVGARLFRDIVESWLLIDHDTNGLHNKVSLPERADPTGVANQGFLYAKDVLGVSELFYMDSAGTTIQVTKGGKLNIAVSAQGDLIIGDASGNAVNLTIGASGTFLKSNGTTGAWSSLPATSDTVSGIVELATNTEALAGADTTRAVTSAGLASSKSLASNGYMKMPGGLIFQWGTTATIAHDVLTTVTFPLAFPTAVFNVQATTLSSDASVQSSFSTSSLTVTSFKVIYGTNTGPFACSWFAVGN